MALFFITGIAGTGKSELALGLRARGYEAYDTDDDALARWQNVATGYIYPKSSVKPGQRTQEFLNQHKWNVPREYVEELALKAESHPVFMCGTANNIDELRDLFNVVFALTIDDDTLKTRLASRTNNDWGKQPQELAQTLAQQKDAIQTYNSSGYTLIDACQPRDTVIDNILTKVTG